MSKLCPHCKSKKVGSFSDTVMCCMACHRVFGKSQLIDATVFDRITASPEVLAPKFIYEATTCVGDGYILPGYKSTITAGFWRAESEAIAATVEKLKEVCDAEKN